MTLTAHRNWSITGSGAAKAIAKRTQSNPPKAWIALEAPAVREYPLERILEHGAHGPSQPLDRYGSAFCRCWSPGLVPGLPAFADSKFEQGRRSVGEAFVGQRRGRLGRAVDISYDVAVGRVRIQAELGDSQVPGKRTTSPQGACAGRHKHASWGSSVPRHKARKRFEVPDKRGTSPQPGQALRRGPRGPPTSAPRRQQGNGQAFPGRRTGSRQGRQPEGGGLVGRRICGQGIPGEGSTLDTQAG